MGIPTTEQIDAAVPPSGTPNRSLTNAVLKQLAEEARKVAVAVVLLNSPADDTTVDLREYEGGVTVHVDAPGAIGYLRMQMPTKQFEGQIFRLTTVRQVYGVTLVAPDTIVGYGASVTNKTVYALQNVGPNAWAVIG